MAEVTTFRTGKRAKSIPGFDCGQVVMLKSGGALMTVREALVAQEVGAMVRVDWKNDDGDAGFADYFVAQLVRFEDLPADVPDASDS